MTATDTSFWDKPRLSLAVAALALVTSGFNAWQTSKNRQYQPSLVVDSTIDSLGKDGVKGATSVYVDSDGRARYTVIATNTGNVPLDRVRLLFYGPPNDVANRVPKSCFIAVAGGPRRPCKGDLITEESLQADRLQPGKRLEAQVDYEFVVPACRGEALEQTATARSVQTGKSSVVTTSAWIQSYPEVVPKKCRGPRFRTLSVIPVKSRGVCRTWVDYAGSAQDAVDCRPKSMRFAAYLSFPSSETARQHYANLRPVANVACEKPKKEQTDPANGQKTYTKVFRPNSDGNGYRARCGRTADGRNTVVWYTEPKHVVGFAQALPNEMSVEQLFSWWRLSG